MYTLLSKTEKDARECALKITDCTFDEKQFEKHCDSDFKKMFTKKDLETGDQVTIYDPALHIVHEGSLPRFPTYDHGKDLIREMTDTELAITGNRTLKPGEKIVNGQLTYTPSPGDDYDWNDSEWVYPLEKKKREFMAEVEKEKARILSEGFLWQGTYQQRCRAEKDIPYIRETLENFNLIPEYSVKWFFTSHPEGYDFTTQDGFLSLRNEGMLFTDKVFRAESGLKLRIRSAALPEDLAFGVREEYLKGLDEFAIPEQI